LGTGRRVSRFATNERGPDWSNGVRMNKKVVESGRKATIWKESQKLRKVKKGEGKGPAPIAFRENSAARC